MQWCFGLAIGYPFLSSVPVRLAKDILVPMLIRPARYYYSSWRTDFLLIISTSDVHGWLHFLNTINGLRRRFWSAACGVCSKTVTFPGKAKHIYDVRCRRADAAFVAVTLRRPLRPSCFIPQHEAASSAIVWKVGATGPTEPAISSRPP